MIRRLRLYTLAGCGLIMWAFLASGIALYLAGNLRLFGHWWWWNFLPYATALPVLRVVAESAGIAALIVGIAIGFGLLSTGDLLRAANPSATLYGKTNWAGRGELAEGGFRETKSPR